MSFGINAQTIVRLAWETDDRSYHTLLLLYLSVAERGNMLLCWSRRTKERVVQSDGVNPLHIRVLQKLRVDVEEDGHVDRLALVQPLLFETETLYLAKVRRDLRRCHTVCCHADDVLLLALVGGSVERQSGLAGQHSYFSLLGREFPGQDVRGRACEGDP